MSDSKISDLIIDTLKKETDVSFLSNVQELCGERLRELAPQKSRADIAAEKLLLVIITECDKRIDSAISQFTCGYTIMKIRLNCPKVHKNMLVKHYKDQGFGA